MLMELDGSETADPRPILSATTDFIPNDVALGGDAEQMILLTGPNVSPHCLML